MTVERNDLQRDTEIIGMVKFYDNKSQRKHSAMHVHFEARSYIYIHRGLQMYIAPKIVRTNRAGAGTGD